MKPCQCTNCEKMFVIDLQEKDHGKGITETFFSCSFCNHRYLVIITNRTIRDRISKFSSEWAKMSRLKNGKEWKKKVWMRKYEKLQAYKAVTNEMIDKLKLQYASS